ncbi:MAG: WYL domain-containing protein [Clostridia bacterium]|nr:WYL domain-containing protein [Clostridia bacterium]
METTAGTTGERRFLLYNYLIRNTSKGRVATRKQLFDYLRTYDIKISVNTFYADLAVLQGEVFNLEIEFDQRRNGYWVKNPPFTTDELRWMIDSIQASKFLTQRKADEITQKIRQLASAEDRKALNRPAIVSDRIRNMNESVIKEADVIHQAIAANRKISFRYFHRSPDRSKPLKYTKAGKRVVVSPYALLWDNGNYYMYAYDATKRQFRTYRVDRMDTILTDAIGRDGLEEYNQKQVAERQAVVFDMYRGTAQRVEFFCHNTITDAIIDRFGNDVLLSPLDDDHFRVSMPVELSPPFYAWVATFGRRIKIVSPQEAVDGMKEFLKRASDMYDENGEK